MMCRSILESEYPYVMEKKTPHLHAELYKELKSKKKKKGRCDDKKTYAFAKSVQPKKVRG